jgi:hypothetical protein
MFFHMSSPITYNFLSFYSLLSSLIFAPSKDLQYIPRTLFRRSNLILCYFWRGYSLYNFQGLHGCVIHIMRCEYQHFERIYGSEDGRSSETLYPATIKEDITTPLWSSGQSSWLQIQRSRVRFSALPDFLRYSGSGTGSTQVSWVQLRGYLEKIVGAPV